MAQQPTWVRRSCLGFLLVAVSGCVLPQMTVDLDLEQARQAAVLPAPVEEPKPAQSPETARKVESLPPPRSAKPDQIKPTATTGAMTIDQVIQTTLLVDPKLRAAFEEITQAQADALTASLKPNPELYMDAQLLPLTREFTVDRQGGPPQTDINVSFPIDWWLFGKRAAAMQAAEGGVRVSESEFADRVRQRVQEAALACYDVLEAKGLRDLSRQDVATFRRIETLIERAVKLGGKPRIDLARLRLDRLKSEQTLRETENALVVAKVRVRAVMGHAGADPTFDVAGNLDDLQVSEPVATEVALGMALKNRPDLEALRRKIAQADAEIESQRAKGCPTVTPLLGYTRQIQRRATGFPDANSWIVAVTMSLPCNDRNQGNVAKAASNAAQSRLEYDAAVAQLRSEVEQAIADLQTAIATTRAVAQEQLKLAREVRDGINQSYEAGGRSLLDVLDAQRNYRETYRLYITSRANYGRASVKINSVLGTQVAR